MTKALTRPEAEAYLIKYMRAGAEAQLEGAKDMIKKCTNDELASVFEAITGQGLILPAVEQGAILMMEMEKRWRRWIRVSEFKDPEDQKKAKDKIREEVDTSE